MYPKFIYGSVFYFFFIIISGPDYPTYNYGVWGIGLKKKNHKNCLQLIFPYNLLKISLFLLTKITYNHPRSFRWIFNIIYLLDIF